MRVGWASEANETTLAITIGRGTGVQNGEGMQCVSIQFVRGC